MGDEECRKAAAKVTSDRHRTRITACISLTDCSIKDHLTKRKNSTLRKFTDSSKVSGWSILQLDRAR